jgi:hypothetical protein
LCILIQIRIGFSSNDLWIRICIQNPDPRANSDEEIVVLIDFLVFVIKKFFVNNGSALSLGGNTLPIPK